MFANGILAPAVATKVLDLQTMVEVPVMVAVMEYCPSSSGGVFLPSNCDGGSGTDISVGGISPA